MDADKLLEQAVRDGIREGVKAKLTGNYNNPFDKFIAAALERSGAEIQALLGECIQACMADPEFRGAVAASVRAALAKTLVQRFGGELEKQVNVLKSDPTTRARITLAIEAIVKERSASA